MDDTDKTQGQTQNQQPQGGGAGPLVKERELPVASQTESGVSEIVRPSGSEVEHKIDRELKEMGVENVSETPQLDSQAQQAGVTHAKASVPVLTQTSKLIQLREELEAEGASRQSTDKSIRWFWEEVMKGLKKLIR